MNIDTIRSDSSEFEYLGSETESPFSSSNPFKNVENLKFGGNSDASISENNSMNFEEIAQLEKNIRQISKYVEELEKKCENQEKKLKEFENRETENISPFSSSNLCKNLENLKIDRLGLTSERTDVSMNENDSMSFNQLVQLEKNMGQITNYVEELEKKCEKYEKQINELENLEPANISKENLDAQEVILEQLSTQFDAIKKKEKRPKPEFLEDFQRILHFATKLHEFHKNLTHLEARFDNPELLDQVHSIRHRLFTLIRDQERIKAEMNEDLKFDQRLELRVQKLSKEIENFKTIRDSASNESIIEQIAKIRTELCSIRCFCYVLNGWINKHLEVDPTNFNLVIDNYNSLLTDRVKEIWFESFPFARFGRPFLSSLGLYNDFKNLLLFEKMRKN